MDTSGLTKTYIAEVDRAVSLYTEKFESFQNVAETIHRYFISAEQLRPLVHSLKYRLKEPSHLKDKLYRKAREARDKGKEPSITCDNLFTKVGDLAGVRILYLRPKQIKTILPVTLQILENYGCVIVEKPFAYTWDDEARDLFKKMGIKTKFSPEFYTSVHLVTKFNRAHFCRCEVQLRTLMEEVWGEVSHAINYPKETSSIACQEQLKVLARVASSGTRLVDSIFDSLEEYESIRASSTKIKAIAMKKKKRIKRTTKTTAGKKSSSRRTER